MSGDTDGPRSSAPKALLRELYADIIALLAAARLETPAARADFREAASP